MQVWGLSEIAKSILISRGLDNVDPTENIEPIDPFDPFAQFPLIQGLAPFRQYRPFGHSNANGHLDPMDHLDLFAQFELH